MKDKDTVALLADESFQRWLAHEASKEESLSWEKWLKSSPENRQKYEEALKLWEMAQFRGTPLPEIKREWHRLQKRLGLSGESHQTASPLPGDPPLRHHRPERRRWSWLVAAGAAVALLAALIQLGILSVPGEDDATRFQLLNTEFGQRVTVTLPDETRIVLNANSSLRYPAEWQADATNVFELTGEAYFDVTPRRDPETRFVIHTADGTISVVGTEFSVYERGRGTRVAVAEGKVEVTVADSTGGKPDSVQRALLERGHLLYFSKGASRLVPATAAVEPYTTWWQNQLVLVQTPFSEIVQRLEETYGIRVRVLDRRLLRRTLSGSIENHNLVVVTDAIAEALKVPVQREGQTITFGKPAR